MTVAVDLNDPCATLAALQQVQFELVTGAKALHVVFRNSAGVSREVTYTQANLAALERMIGQKQVECAAANGESPKRFAIIGGTQRWPR